MWDTSTPEVLVAGAGPVGLYAALALTSKGIRTQIIDRSWRGGTHSYALALHARSLSLLEELGLRAAVVDRARMLTRIGLYQGQERCGALDLPSPIAVLDQDLLEDLLIGELARKGVKVQWSHEAMRVVQNENDVEVTVDQFEKESVGYSVAHTEWVLAKSTNMRVPFVIGADGHRSRIRRALNIAFPEVGTPQNYAVFEFQTDFEPGNELRIVFGEHSSDALWPLPGGYCRWSFEIPNIAIETEREKDRLLLQTAGDSYAPLCGSTLRQLIESRAPWFCGSIGELAWRTAVRFERRLAPSFGEGRVWLAGDSAHLAAPVGMQSMNAGLIEAHDLAQTITGILRRDEPLSGLAGYDLRSSALWEDLFGLHGGEPMDPMASYLPAFGDELRGLVRQAKAILSPTQAGQLT